MAYLDTNFKTSTIIILTLASLKWKVGAWGIQGLPLLAASP